MGAIGLLGLLLAAVGLYGTLVYSVTRRAPEIAVRMAIGASRADVARMVFADSLKLIAWGSAFGLLAASARLGMRQRSGQARLSGPIARSVGAPS